MTRVESSVVVDVDREDVWAFVSDVSRCPEWVTMAEEMRYFDQGETREGFRYTEYGGIGPINAESDWVVTVFDPPRRQVHVGDLGPVDAELTITIEPEAHLTRWTQTVEFEAFPRVRPLGWLLERLYLRRAMARELRETMETGKAILERESARSSSASPAGEAS